MIEPRLQRRDELRERRAAQIGERLGLMDEHRRRALDDVLLDHEREDVEQRLAVHVGERLADVARDARAGRDGTAWAPTV